MAINNNNKDNKEIVSIGNYGKSAAKLFEQALYSDNFMDMVKQSVLPIQQMFADYQCAIYELETKFNVLDEQFSIYYDRNPIESIKSRVKSPDSIINKAKRMNLPLNYESIRDNIRDIAGIRVICSFVEDIYMLADCLLKQDDIILVESKDYIKNPKSNGYRSLHLLVQVPIFTQNGKKLMNVEVQLRTIAMDFWASLEHKLRYKKAIPQEIAASLSAELCDCAQAIAALDEKMGSIRERMREYVSEDE